MKGKFFDRVSAYVPVTDVSMMTEEGQTTEWLGRVVKLRSKYLLETTQNAATATVIRALESIRARTRVVSPKTKYLLTVAKTPLLVPAWKTVKDGGGKHAQRCVRNPDGSEYTGEKRRVVFLTRKWHPNEHYDVYAVRDMHLAEMGHPRAEYYIVSSTFTEAQEYAIKKRARDIRLYGGLAKRSLGWLMHKVSGSGGDTAANRQAQKVYDAVNIARKNLTGGMDTGGIGIYVKDGLNYAVDAVEGGKNGVNDAIKSAVNGIVGQINRMFDGKSTSGGWWNGKIECPFPEVKGSNKKG